MHRIGFDFGGTKVEAVALDPAGKPIAKRRAPNGKEKGYEFVLKNLEEMYDALVSEINGAEHKLGLGVPGIIDRRSRVLNFSPNLPQLVGKPFEKDLAEVFGHPIVVHNDANCFAMAEAALGAGKGSELVFGVIMGTGVGGGIVYKGEVIEGMRSNAAEWGHSTINFNGPVMSDGFPGSVEGYLSGTGVQKLYETRYNEALPMADIVTKARSGDAKAAPIFDEFLEHFGHAMANVIMFLDPDCIVIGGGLSHIDELYSEGLKRVEKYVLNQDLYTPIRKNEYGDSAGMYGAAMAGI